MAREEEREHAETPRPAARRPAGGARGAERKGETAKDEARRPRGHLTGRATILAVVMCAIALSLAYPVREYIAQRRQIAELRHQERVLQAKVEDLNRRKERLGDEAYIKREARRRLHYCMPGEKCYIVLDGTGDDAGGAPAAGPARRPPWYEKLWQSVQTADRPG